MKRGFEISPDEVQLVSDLARWMRIVSLVYFALGALICVFALFTLMSAGIVMLPFIVGAALIVFMSGSWLRKAADAFQRGAEGSEEIALGFGFHELRSYFILTGVLGLLQLAYQLVRLGV
jgi:hypothetical protein